MGVSDRRLHVQLTQEAKIASDFSLFRAIFAFAGFVSALGKPLSHSMGQGFRMLTKSTDCQRDEKACKTRKQTCRQGSLHRRK